MWAEEAPVGAPAGRLLGGRHWWLRRGATRQRWGLHMRMGVGMSMLWRAGAAGLRGSGWDPKCRQTQWERGEQLL